MWGCARICVRGVSALVRVCVYVWVSGHVIESHGACWQPGVPVRQHYNVAIPGEVAESVEHWSRMWDILGSKPGRVKSMTYQIGRALVSHVRDHGFKPWSSQINDLSN